jgi:polyhydroxyalkanoate synthesis regulator phasin
MTADAFYEYSDIKLKNVIERNPSIALDIDLVKYSRKEDGKIRYGYIAQEVQEKIPELVNDGEFLTLNYIDLHSIKIAALENRIKELEAKLK